MKFSRAEILLVEDSQEDLDLTLHSLGHERVANDIIVARDGEEALDLLFCRGAGSGRSFENPPRLVLLDLKLPKVDGLEVLRTNQERSSHQDNSRRDSHFVERRT